MDPVQLAAAATLAGAVLGALVGSGAAYFFTMRAERQRAIAASRYRIYMGLLDLSQHHFWITSREVYGEEASQDLKWRLHTARWKLADELRAADSVDQLPAIIEVLFSYRFATEADRATAIDRVIDSLAVEVNPRYVRAVRALSREMVELGADEWMRRRRKIEPI